MQAHPGPVLMCTSEQQAMLTNNNTAHEESTMTNQYSLGSPRAEELLAAARAMAPALRERAAQCKAERKVPDVTIQDFADAGFFKVLQAEQFGGYAMDPQVFYALGLELAKACPSSAWVLGVVAVHNWQLALFDDQAAQDVWGEDPGTLISSSYAPVGKVTPVEGGYQLSGRWSFSSGSQHCQWVFVGAVVPTKEEPFAMTNYRTFLVPIADYEIVENWDVVGLQGTGSHDIVIDDVFVPEHRTHKVIDAFYCDNPGNAVNTAPLYRMPFMQVFVRAVCTASLGACEGALEHFIEIAKTRVAGPVPMRDDPVAKRLVAEVKSEIEQMKLVMYRNFDQMMDCTRAGEPIEVVDRVRYRYDSAIVADRCLELTGKMLKAAGSGGIRNGSDLLAKHLDILASQAHIANHSVPFATNMGGVLLGQESTDFGI
jgi:3-hydroxy-9,10-secoandrosta-1,3,5(10)-triene-9,17-dione monooxygenase